jgi:hypothetical protein
LISSQDVPASEVWAATPLAACQAAECMDFRVPGNRPAASSLGSILPALQAGRSRGLGRKARRARRHVFPPRRHACQLRSHVCPLNRRA